jgi:hypothetical protein
MTQADSVHSTPPTNTPTSRRRFLSTAATLAAGGAALGLAIPPGAAAESDPIYAAIERHKQACIVWEGAVHVRATFNDLHMTAEQREQRDELDDAVDDARESLVDAGVDLVNTTPTTAAGIVTAIGYMRLQMRDYGTFMPYETKFEFEFTPDCGGDGAEVMGWIDAWLSTIADAAAALDKAV